MNFDKRSVAVILVVGIFASMVTIAFYSNLHEPNLPEAPTSHQTSGLIILEVAPGDNQAMADGAVVDDTATEPVSK